MRAHLLVDFFPGCFPPSFGHAGMLPLAAAPGGVNSLVWLGIHALPSYVAFCVLYTAFSGVMITMTATMIPVVSPSRGFP